LPRRLGGRGWTEPAKEAPKLCPLKTPTGASLVPRSSPGHSHCQTEPQRGSRTKPGSRSAPQVPIANHQPSPSSPLSHHRPNRRLSSERPQRAPAMDRDPQQEFEALFEKLEPWQQQWVACRAAMRVLPALGLQGNFKYWSQPATRLAAIETAPWLVSLKRAELLNCRNVAEQQLNAALVAGLEAYGAFRKLRQPTPSSVYSAAFALFATYASTRYASSALKLIRPNQDFHRAWLLDEKAAILAREAAFATAIADINAFRSWRRDAPSVESWIMFFGRPLWKPFSPPPQFVQKMISRFETSVADIGDFGPAERYVRNCESGAKFEEIQQWLSNAVRIVVDDSTENGVTGDKNRSSEVVRFADPSSLQSDEWWITLLYRLALDDLGRNQVTIDFSVSRFELALKKCMTGESAATKSGLTQRPASPQRRVRNRKSTGPMSAETILFVGTWLESQYGHLPAPPALWRAWFQAVHGEKLREIQEHFARGAE